MRTRLFIFCITGLLLSACADEPADDSPVVATMGDAALRQSEVSQHLPPGLSPEDSAKMAKRYIQNWAAEIALTEKADERIEDLDAQIESRLQAYARQLKIRLLKQQVLSERLNTKVSREELEQYYNANPGAFKANTTYYKYYYFSTQNRDTPQVRERLRFENEADRQIVTDWLKQYGIDYKIDDSYREASAVQALDSLFPVYNLMMLPAKGPVKAHLNPNYDPVKLHFIYIDDIVRPGELKPLSMVSPLIKAMILEKRRRKIIDEFELPIVKEAQSRLEIPTQE